MQRTCDEPEFSGTEISSLGLRVYERNLIAKKGIFRPQTAYSDKVALLKLYPGINPDILDMFYEKGYKGIFRSCEGNSSICGTEYLAGKLQSKFIRMY